MYKEDMRGLFYIARGSYSHSKLPVVECTSGAKHLGGYDPLDETNQEWYMVRDNVVHHCVYAGGDYTKVLEALEKVLVKYKTRKEYFKRLSKFTTEDYYEVEYLGRKPLTSDQVTKKWVGRCPRVSPPMKELYREVFNLYGDFYREDIERVEDLAYKTKKSKTPTGKAKQLLKKSGLLKTTKEKRVPKEKSTLAKKTTKESGDSIKTIKTIKPIRKFNKLVL